MKPTYNTISEVDLYAEENAFVDWENLTEETKARCIIEASEDITIYHNQIYQGTLWNPSSIYLKEACSVQAIQISKISGAREQGKQIRALTPGSYSSGIDNVSSVSSRNLEEYAKFLVDQAIQIAITSGLIDPFSSNLRQARLSRCR
jgi:hypothetical protein